MPSFRGSPLWVAALCVAVLAAVVFPGCDRKDEDPAVTRGRSTYLGSCTSCHHMDPSRDGAIGPAVRGASAELLEAKVLRGVYPAGHTPARATTIMPPQPQLAPHILDLAAFLRAP